MTVLAGRVAIVTGASAGIGEATARALAAAGMRVAVCARRRELNVMAAFTATQAVLPWMRRQGRGHIVNVSSIVGRRGVPYRGAYSATKFALGGLSESLRVELAGTGISVSLVYPIGTATEFHEAEARRAGPGPHGPIQSAEHVARCILRCVRRPRPEVYPFRPSWVLAIASVIAPRLADLGLRRLLR